MTSGDHKIISAHGATVVRLNSQKSSKIELSRAYDSSYATKVTAFGDCELVGRKYDALEGDLNV